MSVKVAMLKEAVGPEAQRVLTEVKALFEHFSSRGVQPIAALEVLISALTTIHANVSPANRTDIEEVMRQALMVMYEHRETK